MNKVMDVLTLKSLKGSRSKWAILLGALAVLAEKEGLVTPGTFGQYKEIYAAAMAYFLTEHFEEE